ncbi:hypothetical protein LX59_01225 [Azomonas agilis]|uniref:Low-complexity protein n=1 Tax=Azomonas agilis TaxID=116849 RepID=A0A562IZH6_9GAMM|nr:hypothetical protein [Azomonas agilis]TWH76302.1 hypothetical protein LX59_01225 [Azomonas agilis]
MKKSSVLSLAMGSAVAVSSLATPAWATDTNPFTAQILEPSHQLAQGEKSMEGKCGEGKCAAKMKEESAPKKAEKAHDADSAKDTHEKPEASKEAEHSKPKAEAAHQH